MTDWTKDSLNDFVHGKLADYLLVVVSNREPYIHIHEASRVRWEVPASGLTMALDPIMRACGGTWIAHGSGDADRSVVDAENRIQVPPGDARYSLKRIWLSKEDEAGYYFGFSNQALWPLCHISYTRPNFCESDWLTYRKVNELFARAVCAEIADRRALVFIQDYHLALLPAMVRKKCRNAILAQFWHIPWPNPEAFRICPWQEELLDGLLGNDLLGFHIQYHCNNFMDTVDRAMEARADRDRHEVTRKGRKTMVRPFPISVDFESICKAAQQDDVVAEMERLRTDLCLGDMAIGLGLDRLDYTKGIPDRIRAIDVLLERYPEYKERIVFVQAGVPSRTHIPAYRALNEEIDAVVEETNWKHGTGQWKPVIYLKQHLSQLSLLALRRMADFCVVSALHDGMNLVAKEYVASRFDENGVLILSPFTGAARELTEAVLVNPYCADYVADAIRKALEMSPSEKKRRMRKMRETVRVNNIYKWGGDILTQMVRFEHGG